MLTRHVAFTVSAVILALGSPVAGDQAGPATPEELRPPASPAPFSQHQPKDPYGDLFRALVDRSRALQAERARSAAAPKVVCGMVLIPADGSVDPGIRVSPPPSSVRYTMRAIEPSMCRGK